jgi:3-oxoacyl-[acyl-carrier protein] reductase
VGHIRLVVAAFATTAEGRVAIVTGGSRGIGREVSLRLAGLGYAVAIGYAHDQASAESTVEAVLAWHGAAVAVRADVTDAMDVERLFGETIETFGHPDVVVHAVHGQVSVVPIVSTRLEDFDSLWSTTARATFAVNREAARHIRDGGTILNVSGDVSGASLPAYGIHAVTTAAIGVVTRLFARELRDHKVTVNAVTLDLDRPCEPDKVADVVGYLLSDEGHTITGQLIKSDPGLLAPPVT